MVSRSHGPANPNPAKWYGLSIGDTAISSLDDGLSFRGYAIEELAAQAHFLEVACLLVRGELPSEEQLADLQAVLNDRAHIDPSVMKWLGTIPLSVPTVDVLRTAISLFSHDDRHAEGHLSTQVFPIFQRLLAQLPVVVAARHRLAQKKRLIEPRDDLSYAGNLLWMLGGADPSPIAERAVDVLLLLASEHEFTPSTFAVRMVASTRSDLYSAIIAGISAFKGQWHGGAGQQILQTLFAVKEAPQASTWVAQAVQKQGRIPGFWHRVYLEDDPRAAILKQHCVAVAEETGHSRWEEVAASIEAAVHQEQGVTPSVDWPAARLLFYLGLDSDQFIPMFVLSRLTGWTAHFLEQLQEPLPIRPRSRYIGPARRVFLPISERG